MKKLTNNIIKKIVVTLVIMCNLFMCQNINALDKNINSYLSDINNNILQLDNKIIEIKNSTSYQENKTKSLTNYFEYLVNIDKNKYKQTTNSLNNINLETIIKNSNNETLQNNYKEHGENIMIDINNIKDITYKDDENTILITKEEINNLLIDQYLKTFHNLFTNYNNNYKTLILENESLYDELINTIEQKQKETNAIFNEINSFEQTELKQGNNPNMLIEKENVYTKLNKNIEELNKLKNNIDLTQKEKIKTTINDIEQKNKKIKDSFFKNNESYEDNGLKENIEITSKKYNKVNNQIKTKAKKFDEETITLYKKVISLETEYNNLNQNINDYLLRKSSDTFIINEISKDLNNIYKNLNQTTIIKILEDKILNETFKDMKTIKLYENLLDIDCLDDRFKQIIIEAKNKFKNKNQKEVKSIKVKPNQKVMKKLPLKTIKEEKQELYELPRLEDKKPLNSGINITETEEQVDWINIFKISLIVFLGALIIYFLNKSEDHYQNAK